MNDWDEMISQSIINEEKILSLIDEYSAYCFYLEFEPELRTPYHSPLRVEDRGSFSLFEAKTKGLCQYLWKDSGYYGGGKVGNIFNLVEALYGIRRPEAIKRLDADFGLGLYKPSTISDKPKVVPPPKKGGPTVIQIKSQPFTPEGLHFWKKFGISKATLDLYSVTQLYAFWMDDGEKNACIIPNTLCFAYRIGTYFKIYQPFDKDFKWRNNYPSNFIEGFLQLEDAPLLIITKSLKDIMLLRELGYMAVSPKAESILIPPHLIKKLKKRYSRIVVLFDNDGKHKADEYEFPIIEVPLASGTKDISDFYQKYGKEATQQLLKQLLK